MRPHPRTMPVSIARAEIAQDFWAAVERHGLTDIETLQVLNHIEAGTLKTMLRSERHPENPEKGADEE